MPGAFPSHSVFGRIDDRQGRVACRDPGAPRNSNSTPVRALTLAHVDHLVFQRSNASPVLRHEGAAVIAVIADADTVQVHLFPSLVSGTPIALATYLW